MKRPAHISWILPLVFFVGVPGLSGQDPLSVSPNEDPNSKLRLAGSQYEIVGILLDEGQFESVPEEFGKILALGLSGESEGLLAEAAFSVADRLREARQHTLAHHIVTATLRLLQSPDNEFKLLMMRAKIFKDQRLFKQAIQTYRDAQKLGVPE